MTQPFFSIITITKNDCSGFEKTMHSIQKQTCNNFEWIVVDGGSTDGTLDLIKKNLSDITWHCSGKDTGIYNAMNIGTEQATGRYLIYMNGGDSFYNNTILESTLKAASENGYPDYLYGNALQIHLNKKNSVLISTTPSKDLLIKHPVCHQSTFFKKDVLTKNSLKYDETYKISADRKFKIQYIQNSNSFYKMETLICNFDMTGISNQKNFFHPFERWRADRETKTLSIAQASINLCADISYNHCPPLFKVARFVYRTIKPKNDAQPINTVIPQTCPSSRLLP